MKTLLSLILCFSVLLSSCITANTAVLEPEPDSSGDWAIRVVGGIGDIYFGMGIGLLLFNQTGAGKGRTLQEALGTSTLLITLFSVGTIGADVVIRNSLPYRKAYYQDDLRRPRKQKKRNLPNNI